MSDSIELNKDDPRFVEAVGAVIEKRLPHLARTEKFLTTTIVVATLLSTVGLLSIGGWAAKIAWQREQEGYIKATVEKLEQDSSGPVGMLSTNLTNMARTLNATFETQVDSATFKALRFGCTPPNAPATPGFPVCRSTVAGAGLFQALDDQSILLIANPSKQIVHLDLSVYPIDKIEKLEPLLLQIYAEPPPLRATPGSVRAAPLYLKAEQLGPNGGDVLQDGRLRVVPSSGVIQASINLTPSLQERGLSGAMQLRFVVVKEQEAAAAASAGDASKAYGATSGTELFFVRTITSAYHSIPAVQPVIKR